MIEPRTDIRAPGRVVPSVIVGAALAAWILACGLGLWLQRSQLFVGFDGSYMLDVAIRQIAWQVPLTTYAMEWFQGLGDIFYAYNARLIPAYYPVAWLGGTETGRVLGYLWWVLELGGATALLAWALGFSRPVAALAAVAIALLMFPFSGTGLVYGIFALVPHNASAISVAMLVATCLVRFARSGPWNLAWAAGAMLGIVWLITATTPGAILATPFLGLCAVSALLASRNRRELWSKLALLAALGCVLLACGPAAFMAGVLFNTAASIFPLELQNDRASYYFASILFHWQTTGPAGPILVMSAVVGAVATLFGRAGRTAKVFAATLLTYLGSRLLFATATIVFDFWRGPSPIYFEFFVIPLYAIFAASSVERAARALPLPRSDHPIPLILAAGAVLALVLPARSHNADYMFRFPPSATPITDILSREAGEPLQGRFGGRVANMVGRSLAKPAQWIDMHEMDGESMRRIGNEHRVAGLHWFDLPSLFQYTSTTTPAFYAFTRELLARPDDRQARSVSVLRNVNVPVLRMIGVRFVLTDAPVERAELRLRLPYAEGKPPLLLYDLGQANLGDWSPTHLRVVGTAAEMTERMKAPDFDGRAEVLVRPEDAQEAGADTLGTAREAAIILQGGALRIRAEANGRALLLLPVEFSRCLTLDHAGSRTRLFRANLLMTALIFEGSLDAQLSSGFGPFSEPTCRMRDRFDLAALRIGDMQKVPQ